MSESDLWFDRVFDDTNAYLCEKECGQSPTTNPSFVPFYNPTINPSSNPTLLSTGRPTISPVSIEEFKNDVENDQNFLGNVFLGVAAAAIICMLGILLLTRLERKNLKKIKQIYNFKETKLEL